MVPKGNVVPPLWEKDSISQKPVILLKLQKSSLEASQSMHREGGLLNKYFLGKGYAKTTCRQKKEFSERMIKH